ncbi:hypothetical protein [Roseibium sp.]|uniref:hypothetical protein n=1 Tax=Roseibium sp. TaxID=1936156 RepID=UPI003A975B44
MVIRLAVLFVLLAGGVRAESLRLLTSHSDPVVGEMVAVTIRGEYTRRIALENMIFPDSKDYDWMQLARDSWRDERVDGRMVKVLERRIALFPRREGPVTIGPVTHRLTLVSASGGREVLDVQADPVTIQAAPFPAITAPLAARVLTVEDHLSASPGNLRDGETLVRTVTLRADDTLAHLLPARPAIRQPWLITFTAPEVRETKPTPSGPETTVIWEWHLRPKTGEPGVLPPITIPWFDTVSREMRTAEIPAIPFGYASFSANRSGVDGPPMSLVHGLIAAFAAGLLTGLLVVFSALTRRKGRDIIQVVKRLSPFDPTRRALRRSVRQTDLFVLRSAAQDYLSRRQALGLKVPEGATTELDRAIYAKSSGSQSFDPERFLRDLLDRRRR